MDTTLLLFLAFLVVVLMIFASLFLMFAGFRLERRASDMQISLIQMQQVVDKVEDARQAMDRLEERNQLMHERQLALLENIRYAVGEEDERLRDIEEAIEEKAESKEKEVL